ncbi:MAG: rhomboid family intramembrane serine protease [Fimbriimonadaceae bacterium]|nr:rhomboid family intramembrane serine protease [Fimbriimonadaceae bacterium]QYK56386.1 MAG: rhomboid family intramembrane serine protease [Fimbriimonadaceae bacterium]
MIPIRDSVYSRETPVVTWTIVALNALIYLWDRGGRLMGPSMAFADLAMVPENVWLAISGGGDPVEVGKIFTAMFLHGSLAHLLGNVIFLSAFGPNVEAALGGHRYALYYLFWGVVAFLSQILVDPSSSIPVLGASGAIGGVLGAYFLLFPGSRMKVVIPPFFWWAFPVAVWFLLGGWFLIQVLFPQDGVATWAHAGGFMAGMLTVLVLGGSRKILGGRTFEEDPHFDDD